MPEYPLVIEGGNDIYIYVCVCDGVVIYLENQLYISINCVFSIATFDYQRGNITHTLIKVYPSVLSVPGYLPGKLVCSIIYDIVI